MFRAPASASKAWPLIMTESTGLPTDARYPLGVSRPSYGRQRVQTLLDTGSHPGVCADRANAIDALARTRKAWLMGCTYEVVAVVQVEGMQLVIDDLVGSTGLELKVDPGVPYVYAGFAGMLNSMFYTERLCRYVETDVQYYRNVRTCYRGSVVLQQRLGLLSLSPA